MRVTRLSAKDAEFERKIREAESEVVVPDHPALPAVSRWLSENPNGTERLWHVLDVYGNSRHAEGDAEQTLSSLIEALSHD